MVKSAYLHIPFCKEICHYCDFCKLYYHQEWITPYLDALEKEIKENYQKEVLKTIYIGGGTPSALAFKEFQRLLKLTKIFSLEKEYEFTVECNFDTLTKEKIKLMKEYGVNRISIGIETMHPHLQEKIGRNLSKEEVLTKLNWIKEVGITNINLDLMYALPEETLEEVEIDLDFLLSLDVPHISTYALIIEEGTKFYLDHVSPISEDLDYEMYQKIKTKLQAHGYLHYETSNYAKQGYASRHNLTYWNNEEYYGFGLGASGYHRSIRYQNTKNLFQYNQEVTREEEMLSKLEMMQNEMILGLRKMEGVNKETFYQKYHQEIEEVFEIQPLLKSKKLENQNGFYKITEPYQYLANQILIYFI